MSEKASYERMNLQKKLLILLGEKPLKPCIYAVLYIIHCVWFSKGANELRTTKIP